MFAADIETFVMFIGFPRSGHSLVGALLDAHPDAVVSNELHALTCGCTSREGLFKRIIELSARQAAEGRKGYPNYDYAVPDQWQGRHRTLRVIGDKKGGDSSLLAGTHPGILAGFRKFVGLPLKVVHVTRNPYDIVSTMSVRDGCSVERSIANFAKYLDGTLAAMRDIEQSDLLTVRHEDLTADPKEVLRLLCGFLGLDCSDDGYFGDCASIVYGKPHRSRDEVEWPADLKALLAGGIEDVGFFRSYSWGSG